MRLLPPFAPNTAGTAGCRTWVGVAVRHDKDLEHIAGVKFVLIVRHVPALSPGPQPLGPRRSRIPRVCIRKVGNYGSNIDGVGSGFAELLPFLLLAPPRVCVARDELRQLGLWRSDQRLGWARRGNGCRCAGLRRAW